MITKRDPKTGQQMLTFSPEEMAAKISAYFDECDAGTIKVNLASGPVYRQKLYSVSGMCVFMGISRHAWGDYLKRPEFTEVCEFAKDRILAHYEQRAAIGDMNPVFAIWLTKNYFGFKDKLEISANTNQEPLDSTEVKRLITERKQIEAAKERQRLLESAEDD